MRRRPGRWVAVAGVLLIGCGSTVREGDPSAGVPPSAPVEIPSEIETFRPDPEETTDSSPRIPEGGSTPADAASQFVATTPAMPPPEAPAGPVTYGPGVTSTEIRIGIPWERNYEAWHALAGYTESRRADVGRVWRIATSAINRAGGILGRKLVPVFYEFETWEGAGPEQLCSYFTEERPVLVGLADPDPQLQACYEEAGVVSLSQATTVEAEHLRRWQSLLAPFALPFEHWIPRYVAALTEQRYFSGRSGIGLVTWDLPVFRRAADRLLEPALAKLGLQVDEYAWLRFPGDPSEIATTLDQVRSAVARFKARGIDRVLSVDFNGYLFGPFTKEAQRQSYRPRYGVSTASGTEWETSRPQLNGAVGIGWWPTWDLEPDEALRQGNDAARRCYRLMRANGSGHEFRGYNSATMTMSACDAVLFLKSAIEAGGPSITAETLVAGAERLGGSLQLWMNLATRLGPGRHAGVAAYRLVRWFTACQCFRYTSPLLDAG